MDIQKNIPIGSFTTFKIGGVASFFSIVRDIEELKKSLNFAQSKNLPTLILGGGSNILVNDDGFEGLVIKIETVGKEIKETKDPNTRIVVVAAGEKWDDLVSYAIKKNLWGIENLSGIPGSVGGAVAGSIGAYGQSISQTVDWVEVLDCDSDEVIIIKNAECKFGYRESLFSLNPKKYVILCIGFLLSIIPKPVVSYGELGDHFGGVEPTLNSLRDTVLLIRGGKFPDLSKYGTAGSFFKNPVVSEKIAQKLKLHYPTMPIFTLPETSGIKIPLAWLLDHVLNLKGMRVGGARLSEHQPLVIVTDNSATSQDVKELASRVHKIVNEKFQIKIDDEVRMV